MSYNVLVIPEDFTKDEHILRPVVEKILADVGRPRARVEVCRDPNFQGITGALSAGLLREKVLLRYPMVDLFVLLVDRDGNQNREAAAANLETQLSAKLVGGRQFVAELARQEVEVFILAGHDLPSDWRWQAIREDPSVKDTYFREFAHLKGTADLPHEGRKKLAAEAMTRWSRIRERCREDIGELIARLQPR